MAIGRSPTSRARTSRSRRTRAGTAADDDRPALPAGPGVLVGMCGADRCRGDLQRRAGVPATQEQERRDHAAAARRDRDHHDGRASSSWPSRSGFKYVDPHDLDKLTRNGEALPDDYDQHTVIAQIAGAVFPDFSPGFYFVVTVTGVILVLAANTAFNGFPVLGSILAKDGYAPRALGARGDRLAYSNGIVFLAVMAIVLIVAFDAETTKLIQLYIVGVFVSFNLSQLGMIRHWTRALATERDPAQRRRMFNSRIINAIGLTFTAVVLVVVLITKFLAGAWITILAMAFFFVGHARDQGPLRLGRGWSSRPTRPTRRCPTRVHAIVLVSKLHKPTLRALAFAKATRPNSLEGVYVSIDNADDRAAARGVGRAQHRRPAQGPALAVPRGGQADRRVRRRHPRRQPARGRRRLHPGVRRRPLVGAAAPQPDRTAAQGPAAVHPRRDGHLRALPAAVLRRSRASARSARRPGATAATCARRGPRTGPAGPVSPVR